MDLGILEPCSQTARHRRLLLLLRASVRRPSRRLGRRRAPAGRRASTSGARDPADDAHALHDVSLSDALDPDAECVDEALLDPAVGLPRHGQPGRRHRLRLDRVRQRVGRVGQVEQERQLVGRRGGGGCGGWRGRGRVGEGRGVQDGLDPQVDWRDVDGQVGRLLVGRRLGGGSLDEGGDGGLAGASKDGVYARSVFGSERGSGRRAARTTHLGHAERLGPALNGAHVALARRGRLGRRRGRDDELSALDLLENLGGRKPSASVSSRSTRIQRHEAGALEARRANGLRTFASAR